MKPYLCFCHFTRLIGIFRNCYDVNAGLPTNGIVLAGVEGHGQIDMVSFEPDKSLTYSGTVTAQDVQGKSTEGSGNYSDLIVHLNICVHVKMLCSNIEP